MTNTVIVGAGPYGLSIAAHLKRHGVRFRIFGRAMDSWISHMPTGMLLKSDGFASNISEPKGDYTLGQFCAEKGIPYHDKGIPSEPGNLLVLWSCLSGQKGARAGRQNCYQY